MLEPGRYRARAIDAALGETKGGKEQVAVAFEVIEGDNQGDVITWYGYFTEGTIDRTFESLRIIGWEGDDVTDLDSARGEASIVVAHEDYEGKLQAKVRWVNRPGGGLALNAPLTGDRATAFAERMRAKAVASRLKAGSSGGATTRPARAPAPHPNAPGSDDGGDPGVDSNGKPLPF